MKKYIFAVTFILFLALGGSSVRAQEQICTQVYGGGVVCGVHTPVETGVGDNLGLIGVGLLVSSLVILKLIKRFKTSQA
jgi:hypothetical protein